MFFHLTPSKSVRFLVLLFAMMVFGPAGHSLRSEPAEAPSPEGPNNKIGQRGPAVPSSSNAIAKASAAALEDKLKLGIGDRLSYRIVEDLEEPKSLLVTDSGDIEVPLIGRVSAVGKTCKQLAEQIKVLLEDEYYHHATVILAIDVFNRTRGKVYLVGYVRSPGPLDIPSDEVFTLSKAIMRAGGFSEYADKKRVRITRKGSEADAIGKALEVDVGAVLEQGHAEKDVNLEVGDLIYVPSRLFKF